MANKFARANGDFNNAAIWSLSATGLSATTVPTIGDNAIANSFTIQITGNVACDKICIDATGNAAKGGTFNLNNGSSVSAGIIIGTDTVLNSYCLMLTGSNSAIISNSNIQGSLNYLETVFVNSSGILTINNSTITSSSQNRPVIVFASPNPTGSIICNNVIAGTSGGAGGTNAISNTGVGSIMFTGILNGGSGATTAYGISNTSTGSITAVGTVAGILGAAINNTSTGSVTVVGNVISDSRGGVGIASSNAAANVRISGNLIGAPNGIPAVYAAAYTVNPVPSQAYIKHANNGTGVGSDAYMYYYTTDSLSAFSVPPISAVRAGLQYANNTLTGTCVIPAASAVTFGALVDNTSGTAAITSNSLFDVSIASLTAANSLGERLKNSATVESVGRIIASFSN